ncbi:hypothetical protein BC332_10963 [Capsicum chinense]|nr:hypothetical protein BC332_10963 [Capsicum chinense]
MKLQGILNGRKVLLLVDSGSSQNFISETIVEELQLLVQVVPYFGVQISNREIIHCNRLCQNLVVKFPGLTIDQDFYPFSDGGADLAKYQVLAIAGLLQPLPIPDGIWEDVSLDFIIGLLKSGDYDTILVVVDHPSYHLSTRTTPFKIVYGRDPPSVSPFVHGETCIAELEEQLLNRDANVENSQG